MCLSLAGGDGVGKKRAGAGRPAAGGAPLRPQCRGGVGCALRGCAGRRGKDKSRAGGRGGEIPGSPMKSDENDNLKKPQTTENPRLCASGGFLPPPPPSSTSLFRNQREEEKKISHAQGSGGAGGGLGRKPCSALVTPKPVKKKGPRLQWVWGGGRIWFSRQYLASQVIFLFLLFLIIFSIKK